MSRNITLRDNAQYIEHANTVIQNNNIQKSSTRFPDNITSEQWEQFIIFMTDFLDSKEAEDLSEEDFRNVQNEISIVQNCDHESGWRRIRDFLGDTANATTILTPVISFIAANGNQIVQWIQGIFK
jgi:transcriptional regulator of heat shock response